MYAEHYAGGAALLFAKPPSRVEVLNDHDDRIVNFYRVAKTQPEKLIAMINSTPYSESEYRKAGKLLNATCSIEKAWALYISLHQGFSGAIGGGWSRGKSKVSTAKTYFNKVEILETILDRLKNVQISNRDALDNIRIYDSEHALHYCDPPYPGCHQGHYSGFTSKNFVSLVECLDATKGSIILSNYDQRMKMPRDWKRSNFPTVKSASKENRNKAIEVVWYRGPK
jgi:DNA adenine methylase